AFPPGGGANFVARLLAQLLSAQLGQAVVVENRPGSNGNVAGEVVAHAAADGYTVLQSAGSLFTVNPHLYAKMPFDPFKGLAPVATVTSDELLLTENPALEPKNFRDFIEYARRAKPPLLYGSIGNGSEHHLAMELLKEQAGIQMTHVPYRGGGPAALGVMGGEVAVMFGGGSATPLVQAGKLRALAISGRKRSPLFPDLPSISEIYPAYDVTIWQGLFVPAATPPAIIARCGQRQTRRCGNLNLPKSSRPPAPASRLLRAPTRWPRSSVPTASASARWSEQAGCRWSSELARRVG